MKLLMIAAAIAAVSFAGCKNVDKGSNPSMKEMGEIGYSDIISYIVEGYQDHWDEGTPEDLGLSDVYGYCSPEMGFSKKDIDGDGIDELVIGENIDDGPTTVYDIYSINMKDGSLFHPVRGGERDRFYILSDGTVIEEGSNSAFDSFSRAFYVKDGELKEVNRAYSPKDFTRIELDRFIVYAQSANTNNYE